MRRLGLTLALCSLSASAFAQNPVSIQQIGPSTAVTTTVPVSGTVTATQSTASSLNATVVQGTASALNATVVGTGTFVVQAQQSGSWTATVTQATASSLNATVVGTGTFATQATLQAGSNQIGHLEANQSVNLAQVAGASISQTNPVPTVFPGTLVSGAVTSAMTGTTSTSVVSGTASNYLYITNCVASNGSTTVSTDILLQDGSGGTTLYVIPAPAATTATTGGSGAVISFPVPLKVPTSGNALYAANVTTSSSTKISCSGFRSTVSY